MGSYKTAAPCVVCGLRCKHGGSDKGFVVGYTTKAIPRLVHERCRHEWRERKDEIMATWSELRPEVLASLPVRLRFRIERCRQQQREEPMSRVRSQEPFNFPPEVREWLKERLVVQDRHRGNIKDWFLELQQDHPTWMPKVYNAPDYSDFRTIIIEVETWIRQHTPPPVPLVAPTPPPNPIPVVDGDDLPAMAQAAHAMIDTALARRDREAVEFALEALAAHLFTSTKK